MIKYPKNNNTIDEKRRDILSWGLNGAIGAILTYVGYEHKKVISFFNDTPENHQLKDPNKKIQELTKRYTNALKDKTIWGNINKLVVGDSQKRNRYHFITDYFANQNSNILSDDIKERLSRMIGGLALVESGYDNSKKSEVGAKGILQIMPNVFDECTEKNEDRNLLTTQVSVAFKKFEQSYETIFQNGFTENGKKIPPISREKLIDQFNLTESQVDNLITLILVNSYNTGEGRMLKILNNYVQTYSYEETYNAVGTKTELGIFNHIQYHGRDIMKHMEGYGEDSYDYPLKVVSASKSISPDEKPLLFEDLTNPNNKIISDITTDRRGFFKKVFNAAVS